MNLENNGSGALWLSKTNLHPRVRAYRARRVVPRCELIQNLVFLLDSIPAKILASQQANLVDIWALAAAGFMKCALRFADNLNAIGLHIDEDFLRRMRPLPLGILVRVEQFFGFSNIHLSTTHILAADILWPHCRAHSDEKL